jgi:hypothetical protein
LTADNVVAAKAIRTQLRKMAKTDERLAGAKVRVVCDSASLMSSIAVKVEDYQGEVYAPAFSAWLDSGMAGARPAGWKNTQVGELADELYRIVAEHWQWDGRHRFADVQINGISF